MGWKGVLREVGRAAKKAQREQERREKELRKKRRRQAAASEVTSFEYYLEDITSIHCNATDPIDWKSLHSNPPPDEPSKKHVHEKEARKALTEFEPTLLDKLLGRTQRRLETLRDAVDEAKQRDRDEFEEAQKAYETARSEWEAQRELCDRVLNGSADAYSDVLDQVRPFDRITRIEGLHDFEVHSSNVVSATVGVQSDKIVPSERKRQLKSGKLSVTDMPKTKYYGYYCDYVASSVLRTGRELHALLPIEVAIATAVTEILNPATGHIEQQPILSAAIPRTSLDKLNLARLSPSDAMANFVHEMNFQKTKGFKPASSVDPERFLDSTSG